MQFARSDVQRGGLDQTVLRSVSATTGANVTPKLDSASVLKVSLVPGVYVQLYNVATFESYRSLVPKGHLLLPKLLS